ncbi:hypothetical protein [uncultured Methanospirillum sp.]|uniref:hypothetical protein n=1 Tax=uncultured Methanospirillum sp. TaxID=262503 RepID=UPI0029C70214|nr:hypothetical protein [uncultured Methanospirillum sp.]
MTDIFPWRRPVKVPIPTTVKTQLIRHFSIGLLYPINDEVMEVRQRSGLSPVPPTAHGYPEAVQDIQTLIRAMKVDKKIGLDLDTMEYQY